MYKTPSFYKILMSIFFEPSPELGTRTYGIANRRTLVSGVLYEKASKSDFIGVPVHCGSVVL